MLPRTQWDASLRSYDGDSSSSGDSYSDHYHRSHATDLTEYSFDSQLEVFPYDESIEYVEKLNLPTDIARDSASTYTTASDSDFSDLESDSNFDVLDIGDDDYVSDAIPSTPRDFADFFPTTNCISIAHDDSSIDGNMNLRVDRQIELRNGTKRPLTLFHLRMHDLKSRTFSLRRYCRDSGREVCNSVRKYQNCERPGLQRSLSNAIASLRGQNSLGWHGSPSLNRTDSGYGSMHGVEEDHDRGSLSGKRSRKPTNVIKLEFSNYAQVEVKRCGVGSSKRYAFEYWGVKYAWKRSVLQDGEFTEVSFHLYRDGYEIPSAHIVPFALTSLQSREEKAKGGWVPPCSMWIKDKAILSLPPDVADVVVATGLMALVDESIEREWPSERPRSFVFPLTASFFMDLEYIGARKLIDEMFNRDSSHVPTIWRAYNEPFRQLGYS